MVKDQTYPNQSITSNDIKCWQDTSVSQKMESLSRCYWLLDMYFFLYCALKASIIANKTLHAFILTTKDNEFCIQLQVLYWQSSRAF